MKTSLKIEELAQFVFGIFLFSRLSFEWWWFPLLILTPDIGMIGYLFNTKTGAWIYNLFHHKGVGVFLMLIGFYFKNETLSLIGIILFSHSSLDRIFGYGLKYPDSFHKTHLGEIGEK